MALQSRCGKGSFGFSSVEEAGIAGASYFAERSTLDEMASRLLVKHKTPMNPALQRASAQTLGTRARNSLKLRISMRRGVRERSGEFKLANFTKRSEEQDSRAMSVTGLMWDEEQGTRSKEQDTWGKGLL